MTGLKQWWACKTRGHALCPCDRMCWGKGRSPCLREVGGHTSTLYAAPPGTSDASVDEPGQFPSAEEYDALCLTQRGMHFTKGSSHGRS